MDIEVVRKMKILKFRTKIEVITVLFFLLVIAIFSVASVNRTITESSDTIETVIRNTKGNIWEPTGTNLQAAINDLSGKGGTVWVGSDITLSSEIKIQNSNDCIIIDFQGNKVSLNSRSIGFILLTNTNHVTVKNVVVRPHRDSTASIIKLYIDSNGGSTSHNTFSHIYVANQGPREKTKWDLRAWTAHNFTVIEMMLNGPGEINQNTFIRISAEGPSRGIYFNQRVNTGWINGTYVDDFWLDQYRECIRFRNYQNNKHSFNYNRFSNVKVQSCVFTEYGIRDISGFGNHFDHVLMWDWYVCSGGAWSNSGIAEYSITADADSTYMNLHAWSEPQNGYIINNGKNTMVIVMGKIRIGG